MIPDAFSTGADRHSARLNGLKGEVRFPWEAIDSGLKSRTFWAFFNTVYLGRSEFSQVSCQLVALRSSNLIKTSQAHTAACSIVSEAVMK